jgi:hypothetical protein
MLLTLRKSIRGYRVLVRTRSLPLLGSGLAALAALTSTWTGVKVLGVNLCDALILLGIAAIVVESALGARSVTLRWWMPLPTVAALVIYAFDQVVRGGRPSQDSVNLALTAGTSAFGDSDGGFLFVARLGIATLLVAVIVGSEVETFGVARAVRLLLLWTAGATVSAAAAVAYSLGLADLSEFTYHAISEVRALGLAFHPNSLAQTIAITMPLAIYFLTTSRTAWARIWWLAGAVLGVWALVLANSRGGLIVGLCATVVALASVLGRSRGGRLFGMVLAVPAVLAVTALVDWLLANTRLGGQGGASQSDEGRWEFLQMGFDAFLNNPLIGAGVGGGAGVMVPLLLLSTGGLILFLGYYAFIAAGVHAAWPLRNDPLVSACLISVMALVGYGLFNNSVNERYNFIGVAILAAVALRLRGDTGKTPGSNDQPRARVVRVAP